MLPCERRALRQETLVLWFLVGVMLLATFCEPLLDWAETLLR